MKSMRLSEINSRMMNRSMMREMNEQYPKVYLHKNYVFKMKKQKKVISLSKARSGAHIRKEGE